MPMEPNQRYEQYIELRERWPVFHYHGWMLTDTAAGTCVTYRFEIPGLAVFEPTLTLPDAAAGRNPVNSFDSPLGRRMLFSLGMVELVSYWKATCSPTVLVHAGWLEEGQLIRDAHRLKDIPGLIVHGRYDMPCPARYAWQLHKAWPKAEFYLIEGAGHAYSEPGILDRLIYATDKFAGKE